MGLKKIFKYVIAGIFCNLFRLLHIPNADPIMGTMLPFAKRDNGLSAGIFAFITMFSFDIITNKVGIWTIVTATTFGLLGWFFAYIYRNKERLTLLNYITGGVFGVLIFDFITGPIMSSFLFHMSFIVAFVGQIPFTLLHLATVCIFIIVLVPILDKYLINTKTKVNIGIPAFN
ncbi:MAG: hypothetical protein WCF78_02630 [archaeon]